MRPLVLAVPQHAQLAVLLEHLAAVDEVPLEAVGRHAMGGVEGALDVGGREAGGVDVWGAGCRG